MSHDESPAHRDLGRWLYFRHDVVPVRMRHPEAILVLMVRFRFIRRIEIPGIGRTVSGDMHDNSLLVCAGKMSVSSRLRINATRWQPLQRSRIKVVAVTEVPHTGNHGSHAVISMRVSLNRGVGRNEKED
jgi:hypothetical protein